MKGSIDKLVCWLAFGAYGFVFLKKKHQTKNFNKCDFYAFEWRENLLFKVSYLVFYIAMTCGKYFGEKRSIPSFPHTWA